MEEKLIGKVSHYFGHLQVAAIEITDGELNVGDTIHIKGHTSDFTQKIDEMQIEHKSIAKAIKGQGIGIKIKEHTREHDKVFKVIG